MPKKICKECGSKFFEQDKLDYIIPESYKKRNNEFKKNNNLSYLCPSEKEYIKPKRLQIFNDEYKEFDNKPEESKENENLNVSDNQQNLIQNDDLYKNQNISDLKTKKKFKPLVFKNLEEILPKEIAGEILLGKFKGILKIILGIILFLGFVLSLWYYFFFKTHSSKLFSNNFFISLPFGIALGIISIFIFFYGIFQYNNFRMYGKKYTDEFSKDSNSAQYPPFLREIYIKRIKWRYYIILIAALCYTVSLIIVPLLYLIQHYEGESFSFAWWTIGKTPNVKGLIIGFWVFLGIVTLLLLLNILINEKRHSIMNIYTSNNVLTEKEKQDISKSTKKKCLIIYFVFLCILIILFIIPLIAYIVKKVKNRK